MGPRHGGLTDGRMRCWGAARAAVLCSAFLIAAMAFAGEAGHAATTKPVVLKPKPGQQITRHPVRFVVHAGPEVQDLKARLNGVAIGRQFLVRRPGIRELSVSSSHGLRHGRNVLKVTARTRHGTRVRRSTVRFTVAHRRPLAGAGRDRRAVVGSPTELRGRVIEHPHGPSGDRVRWKLVHAPRGSRLRRGSGPKRASGPASASVTQPTSLSPAFKPDVVGTYTFKMTAGVGSDATSDRVDLTTVPANPLVDVDPTAPSQSGRPGIEVGTFAGKQTYLAPFISKDDGGGYVTPGAEALFQVLVLDRATTAVVSNRTYALCFPNGGDPYLCRANDSGDLVPIAMGDELSALGPQSLVIVNTLPATTYGENDIVSLIANAALDNLTAIGFPDRKDTEFATRLNATPAGSLSVIGVPGMKPGEAEVNLSPAHMSGYLVPDKNTPKHYGYISAERLPFDSRATAAPVCTPAGCTVTQTTGDQTYTHTEKDGAGGFLVSVYGRDDLRPIASDYFTTVGGAGQDAAFGIGAMDEFLEKWSTTNGIGNVVMITSIQTFGLNPQYLVSDGISDDEWYKLASQVAGVGGTLDKFNRAAITPQADYTLVGYGGAGEGNGVEAVGDNARIRGVLVPDDQSNFTPANIVAGDETRFDAARNIGEPPEKLIGIALQAPGATPWPGDPGADPDSWGPDCDAQNTPGVRAAISFIGARTPRLNADPRTQYWLEGYGMDTATVKSDMDTFAQYADYHWKTPVTAQEFASAKCQLKFELDLLAKVQTYLKELAYPGRTAGADAWAATQSVANTLKGDLAHLNEEAEMALEAIEGGFGIIANLLDLGSVVSAVKDWKDMEHFLLASAAALELTSDAFDLAWDGSSATTDPNELQVKADEVGEKLQEQATAASRAFETLFDIIVSDPDKLMKIGLHGGCVPGSSYCSGEWEELVWNDDLKDELSDVADLVQERTVYEHLVPYAFPVWNTGLTYSCAERPCKPDTGPDIAGDPLQFHSGHEIQRPFTNAPAESYYVALEELDPDAAYDPAQGGDNIWRVWLSVAYESLLYYWADQATLDRMFTPVNEADVTHTKGLGIDPLEFMMHAWERDPWVDTNSYFWRNGP